MAGAIGCNEGLGDAGPCREGELPWQWPVEIEISAASRLVILRAGDANS